MVGQQHHQGGPSGMEKRGVWGFEAKRGWGWILEVQCSIEECATKCASATCGEVVFELAMDCILFCVLSTLPIAVAKNVRGAPTSERWMTSRLLLLWCYANAMQIHGSSRGSWVTAIPVFKIPVKTLWRQGASGPALVCINHDSTVPSINVCYSIASATFRYHEKTRILYKSWQMWEWTDLHSL